MESPPQDFMALQQGIQKTLVSTVKSVNRLASEDLPFQRTVNPDTAQQLDENSSRILQLSARLMKSAAAVCNVKPPRLHSVEDVDLQWQSVVDVVDCLLERADSALDEFTGLIKRTQPLETQSSSASKPTQSSNKVIRNANIPKPQLRFERRPNNFPKGPWKPLLTEKPHATLPLGQSLVTFTDENNSIQFKHPYEAEITCMQYPTRLAQVVEPRPPQPAESTTATWVDTFEGVLDMLRELEKADEIAVDLEHHDFRTYNGIVCLMQISTRKKDWIVDTLQPWRHRLEVLNNVFANPAIVKVFHGAFMDIIWLQRDLELYVNGLFDTYFACDVLSYPGKSLAFLLSKFVNFEANKQYQLADWRVRPIPPDMLYYARSDTHYLLYIYDCLRNALVTATQSHGVDSDYMSYVLHKSREQALSRYEHPSYDEETGKGSRGWYNLVLKQPNFAVDGKQFASLRALWKWRDMTARQEDESVNYVLSTHHIISIISVHPPDAKALHSLLPLTASLARARVGDIWHQLQEARATGGPSMLEFLTLEGSEVKRKPDSGMTLTAALALPEAEDNDGVVRRLSRSQLFGDMAISSLWEPKRRTRGEENEDDMPLSWERFAQARDSQAGRSTDEVDQTQTEMRQATVTDTAVKPPGADASGMAEDDDDEEFTLKKGRKRKSESMASVGSSRGAETLDANETEPLNGSGSLEMGDSAAKKSNKGTKQATNVRGKPELKGKKHEERLARKVKRREQKKEKQKNGDGQTHGDDEAPFDYTKASSVLHANRSASGSERGAKTAFDPYARTGDEGLKGSRKAPPVRGERSATFRR